MKTILAVILFGVLIYPSHGKLEYKKGKCQRYGSMVDFDPKRFFTGNWSLVYSTPSARVTQSTINRDYILTMKDNDNIDVIYGYNENGCGNHYDVRCNGTRNSDGGGGFNFDCRLHNGRQENTVTHIDAYFIATNYDNYGVVYRCVKGDDGNFIEDNLFILFRPNKTDDDYAKVIIKHYGLSEEEFITRQNTTCPNSEGVEKKEQVEEGAETDLIETGAKEGEGGNGAQEEKGVNGAPEEQEEEEEEEEEEDEGEEAVETE
uniref:Pallidipin-like lipocalin n=1 Tax=Triatoma matogrossensis TaxID=162370 RepID=E2J713_9HEMI